MQYLTLSDFCQLMQVFVNTVLAVLTGVALLISITHKKK